MTKTATDMLAADIRAIDGGHSLGAGALAEALIGRGWRAPVTVAPYVKVGEAVDAQIGELVRSRWSSSGAVWRVVAKSEVRDNPWGGKKADMDLEAINSNRKRSDSTDNLEWVDVRPNT